MLHKDPSTYIDMLSIIEHPAFLQFYNELIDHDLAGIDTGDIGEASATGDIMRVGLKDNYADYDMTWPVILHDAEEEIKEVNICQENLEPFSSFSLEQLRKFLATDGETFVSQEITSKRIVGRYTVNANLFTAESYNEYLQKLLRIVTMRMGNEWRKGGFPMMQIDEAVLLLQLTTLFETGSLVWLLILFVIMTGRYFWRRTA